jgi:site-specific DNA-methyltransferase (adenine-specific)
MCGHGSGHHPAPMSMKACKMAVKLACPAESYVLDPFCGSGTSGVAAIEARCHFTGIDASKDYIDNICIPRLVERVSRNLPKGKSNGKKGKS